MVEGGWISTPQAGKWLRKPYFEIWGALEHFETASIGELYPILHPHFHANAAEPTAHANMEQQRLHLSFVSAQIARATAALAEQCLDVRWNQ